ncbi:hypothetical protein HOF56_03510 [Candidatus Peribacteria bacterium]|jgi:hypothetical protein|nr:hypothetical protein [Candidatus Peribacteria bacterium]MBT4021082.1 hypothetical protein [Candidatus Peribacteria bacterium]MBT4240803.1 hypothetical protein [Candidatus Peribacteria bacterium]MBT4474168.1 hypothetical protein [Candidatus Peribacteria bacterium]
MKKALPIFALTTLLALSACGGDLDDPLARDCEVERTEIEDVSLCLPTDWTIISQGFGEQSNYVIMVSAANSGSVMQLHVKKDDLQEPVKSTTELSEKAVDLARQTAPNYSVVSTDPITIDGKDSILHIFDAQPAGNEESVRYYQFVTTSSGYMYGFTAVMKPGLDEYLLEIVIDVLKGIRFI